MLFAPVVFLQPYSLRVFATDEESEEDERSRHGLFYFTAGSARHPL